MSKGANNLQRHVPSSRRANLGVWALAGKALAFGGDFAYRYGRSIWNGTTT